MLKKRIVCTVKMCAGRYNGCRVFIVSTLPHSSFVLLPYSTLFLSFPPLLTLLLTLLLIPFPPP